MAPPVLDPKTEGELKAVFYAFASFGLGTRSVEIEGKNFIKLCKDCKLMSKALTTTDIDLIFTKAKTKGARKVSFEQFMSALDAIAAKKGTSYEEIVQAIISAGGPVDGGTKAEASTYTGVYAKGGPTNVDTDPASLASVCDRTPADARGVKVGGAGAPRRSTGELIGARRSTGDRPAGSK
ncbi:hypothetical protein Rsub_06574 [Raphidocelis subcapitata]|uniref:Uncharacterized protein n=1 Tax=Raphidocelis subcapitata TaxID=307507 RepID=A0A2V0P0P5_9CHLO|nr:hypothetical protein Rsub_06574 [Raphidocelis subcapitata]|eukprot:GBF93441.1 hypothetical protein Rsub_06574 [Raphidocelis subcapitata]